jgi:hypothetical protein
MYRRSKVNTRDLCTDEQCIAQVKGYLNSYQAAAETLMLLESERQDGWSNAMAKYSAQMRREQRAYWQARVYRICALVDSVPFPMEKMLLHYHYILGYSVEAAAEAMDVSRRTAYRIKKRALALAALLFDPKEITPAPPPIQIPEASGK